MARLRLYCTRALPDPVMTAIRKQYELVQEPPDYSPSQKELQQGFSEADAVITTLAERVDHTVLACANRLKIIANYAVGYNNIDVAAAGQKGIIISNTPDVLTDATADLTWALLLASARRVTEGDRWMRTGQWTGWAPTQMLGGDVAGKTLGIIGMGRIGQAVALRAVGFRMPVLYTSRRSVTVPVGHSWHRHSLGEVLAHSDFLSLHVPLTETTRHLIGAHELQTMKPTAFLINTSRGPVIDEAALVSALETGLIAGAGLDVYEQEPAVPASLATLPNVVLLPHLGSATLQTRIRMGMICLENVAAVLSGNPAPNRVG
ncbi:MAG TPA: D-glycerate dehydrogenase [Nitrospira sp.]|nr:D-glycerate dehydrogenase [Nitrospira sp.]